jgi:hypothetical protein
MPYVIVASGFCILKLPIHKLQTQPWSAQYAMTTLPPLVNLCVDIRFVCLV